MLRLTDAQRRRLAVRGQKLGRQVLTQVAGIVTPDTILHWSRQLIAKKYEGSGHRRRGRPLTPHTIAELVVRMAVGDQFPVLRTCCELVARHSGIDELGPGVDPTP